MKILFVISCLNYGGAEKNMVLVANHLCQQRHGVAICNFNEHETRQILHSGIRCHDMPVEGPLQGRFAWLGKRKRQYQFLKQVCKNEKPDVLVSFLGMPNALSVICGKKLRIPVVISERADPYQVTSKLDSVMHVLYNWADGAVFQTDGAKAFYAPRLQRKSTVIPNPVILQNNGIVHQYENTKKEIAFVGRFEVKQKRQDIMLRAMQKVLEKHPDYKLIFWGDGADETAMQDLAVELGIAESVIFAGVSKCSIADIAQCELFVMTSDYEGIPNVLIEAMSIGLPCVATDCSPGGARMLLRNGEDGLLVPCRDVEAVAMAINELIENKDLAKEYGLKAQKIVERFCYADIMSMWEQYLTRFQG